MEESKVEDQDQNSVNQSQKHSGGVAELSPRPALERLTDEQLREAEHNIADQKREREHAKWDAELVGRYFRIIRAKDAHWWSKATRLGQDDYVTLERSLAVGYGHVDNFKRSDTDFVYADVVYLHIQERNDSELTCSGFEVSHESREAPYLKIQPVFRSWSDFRNYLNSWSGSTGPTKHFDEISKDDYIEALGKAVSSFTTPLNEPERDAETTTVG